MQTSSDNQTTDTIELRHVTFSYRTGDPVLKDCSLTIHRGDFVILTGGSGSGKTTVTRLINGLGVQYYEGTQSGMVSVFGVNPEDTEISETAQIVGSVFQNPRTQFFNVNTTSELTFACENQGLEREEILRRLNQVTGQYRLQPLLDRSLFELSGGEQQRIACAGVTMAQPQVIVLDEPSANLDYQAIGDLHRILTQWKAEGRTIIIAEHRLFYLRDLADRMVVMENGRIVREYKREELLRLSNEDASAMGLRPLKISSWFDSVCSSYEVNGLNHELRPSILQHDTAVCRNTARASGMPDRIIRIDNLRFHYRNGQNGIEIGHLDLPADRIVAITGHNGAGKSTLVRCLSGLEKKCRATIRESAIPPAQSDRPAASGINQDQTFSDSKPVGWRERIRRSYLVMQDVNLQLFSDSVEGEVWISREYQTGRAHTHRQQLMPDVRQENTDADQPDLPEAETALLRRLDLYDLRNRHPLSLSGGQRQRTAIAGALAAGKEWLFFDEPTSGLDLRHMKEFAQLLRQLSSQGRSIFVITHDPELILASADYCLTLSDGKVQELYPMNAAGVRRVRDYFRTAYLQSDKG